MRSSKHIVFFAPSFPKDETNTIVTPPVHLLARSLTKLYQNELKVTVVALHFPFREGKYRCFGIDVYPVNAANCGYPSRFLYWRKAVRTINRLHRKHPVSLIHTFWLSECPFLVEYFLKRMGIPHLNTMMGQDVLDSNRFLQFLKNRPLAKVAVSTVQNEELLKQGIQPAEHVIPWGFDSNEQVSGNKERPIDMLAVGSFISLKRMHEVIETIAVLETAYGLRLNCVLIGEGPLQQETMNIARQKQLKSTIEFRGKRLRSEVMKTMESAKVLLHPSQYEAGPMVVLEALGKGCNVVSRKVGLAHDISTEKWRTGESVEEFARHVKHFLEHPGHGPFVHLTFDEIARKYYGLYQGLISSGR